MQITGSKLCSLTSHPGNEGSGYIAVEKNEVRGMLTSSPDGLIGCSKNYHEFLPTESDKNMILFLKTTKE